MSTKIQLPENMRSILESKIQYMQFKVDADMKKLQENFTYYLPWCGEELWKNQFMLEHFQHYASNLPEGADTHHEWFTRTIAHLKDICTRSYNVRVDSTGALHRETSTWKFQCQLELIEFLETLVK